MLSGSALLKLEEGNADLSRRQIAYTLHGLSFREYLEFEGIECFSSFSLEDILTDHMSIAAAICEKTKILSEFDRCIYRGFYPFYKEVFGGYYERIVQMINQVLENDYPAVEDITFATIQKTKKLLMLLAKSAPQTPNMSKLYKELETDRNLGMKMLGILTRAGIINVLGSKSINLKNMSRPDKMYCNNTNISAALVSEPNIGTMRETFFLNQLSAAGYNCTYPAKGDFSVNGKYLFEVGSKGKSFDQIKDIGDSFLAVDGIETGYGNRIPLWLFGFLY